MAKRRKIKGPGPLRRIASWFTPSGRTIGVHRRKRRRR